MKTKAVLGMAAVVFVWCCVGMYGGGASADDGKAHRLSRASGVEKQGNPKETTPEVQIALKRAGVIDSTVFGVEIQNVGSQPVDMTQLNLFSGKKTRLSKGGLEVVRGSCELAPGEEALLITHWDVPTDDLARKRYAHIYRAVRRDGPDAGMGSSTLALTDASGAMVSPTGPIEDAWLGLCCDSSSIPCSGCPGCGNNNVCVSKVSRPDCCNMHDGCCWFSGISFCPMGDACHSSQCPCAAEDCACP